MKVLLQAGTSIPGHRRAIRAVAGLAVGMLLAQCVPDGGTAESGTPSLVAVALRPVLPPNFHLFAGNLTVDQIRLALVRPPSDTIAIATRTLSPDSSSVRFAVTTVLNAAAESLLAVLEYQTAQGVTLFRGEVMIEARGGGAAPTTPDVPLSYSGPGGNIAFLQITPAFDTLTPGDSTLYQVTALDSSQQAVPNFYVSWSTSDSRVPINAVGLVRAPNITNTVTVTAATPNGTGAQASLTILGGGVTLSPDSVELLPGGRTVFTVSAGPPGPYTWLVNDIVGGNAMFGTIDAAGLYIAPDAVPNPATFKVCARVTAAPTQIGCAGVLISPVPSAGTDVIVINDMNVFDVTRMTQDAGNRQFAVNLVNFSTTGSRGNGTIVMYDRGRASSCFFGVSSECADPGNAVLDSVIMAQGFTITKVDTMASWTAIPPGVKVIFLWNPTIPYTRNDINGFKQFAAQGGRIVFVGEHSGFYLQTGIDTENQFLADMGSQFTNVGAVIGCSETLPANQIQAHQTTAGLTSITIACASQALPGPNDFPLLFESTGLAVAGVAKISTVPLPAPETAPPVATPVPARPVVDGVNRPLE